MDDPNTQKYAIEHPLITMILHVGDMVEDELDHNLSSIGLSITQLSALDNISRNKNPIALSELATQKACVKSNITQLIDRMESKGLVKRRRSEKDRRKVLTVITSKGEQLYHKGMEILKATENEMLSRLSDRQKEKLAHLLRLIVEV